MRPDVVWFGEMPYDDGAHLRGTSPPPISSSRSAPAATSIRPPASSPRRARHGAHTVELNLEPSDGANLFHEAIHGPATQIVPAYVERLLRLIGATSAESYASRRKTATASMCGENRNWSIGVTRSSL